MPRYDHLVLNGQTCYSPIVKQIRCTVFKNLFILINALHFWDGLSVNHQEIKTEYTATGT